MIRAISLLLICSVLVLATALQTDASAPIEPKDANLFVQQEVGITSLGLLAALVGEDLQPVNWVATVTDSQWTYSASVPYRDGQLTMSYEGNLDSEANVILWTGKVTFTNSFGSLSWDEEGSY